MKVILYMAISVNGFIAKTNHETPWTDAELQSYRTKVQEVGNVIVGKTTFDMMCDENIFTDLGKPLVVVLTSSKEKPSMKNVVFVENFKQAIKTLEEKGFSTALVGGGGQADTAALHSGLLDELFIDIEPLVFGKGIPLFSPCDNNLQLKFLESKKNGESGIQLHYAVVK